MPKVTLAVVDDQKLFRDGLVLLLKEYPELDVIIQAVDGKDLLEQLRTKKKPDIILLDLEMPQMDGIETTILLKKKYPDIRIIILTLYNEEQIVIDMIKKGVNGFIAKDTDIEILVDAIHEVKKTGVYMNNELSKLMVKRLRTSHKKHPSFNTLELTKREVDVLSLICKEFTIKEIAAKLNLSPRTVETHRENMMKKMGVRNTAGLVLYTFNNNLLE